MAATYRLWCTRKEATIDSSTDQLVRVSENYIGRPVSAYFWSVGLQPTGPVIVVLFT